MVQTLWKGSAPLTAAGLLMIAALAAAVVGLAIDPRIVTGAPVWLKPAKFAVSNAIYMFTLAWIFTLIPEWTRTRRLVGWTTAVILVMETAIIGLMEAPARCERLARAAFESGRNEHDLVASSTRFLQEMEEVVRSARAR